MAVIERGGIAQILKKSFEFQMVNRAAIIQQRDHLIYKFTVYTVLQYYTILLQYGTE